MGVAEVASYFNMWHEYEHGDKWTGTYSHLSAYCYIEQSLALPPNQTVAFQNQQYQLLDALT